MLGWWRRKNDGFEWREYVRTTIKIRREDRARKIEEIKQAAADGARAAGRRGVATSWSGLTGFWRAVVFAAKRVVAALGAGSALFSQAVVVGLKGGLKAVGRGIAGLGRRLVEFRAGNVGASLRSISVATKIAAMFGVLGVLAGLSAILQFRQSGVGWSMLISGLLAVVLLGLAGAPWLRRVWSARRFPQFRMPMPSALSLRSTPGLRSMAWPAAILVAAGIGAWSWQSGGLTAVSSSLVSSLPSVGLGTGAPDIAGTARAISGDTIRIGGRTIRLAGIEAPEVSQICRDKRNRAWRCGRRARSALRRMIRRVHMVCRSVEREDAGRYRATCFVGKRDVARELVASGYAFAQGMIFKTYAEAESAAQAEKAGVWQGEAQRPADFRAARWELARKSAPDGCPIKGQIVRKLKVYVLPWALEYRQVRVTPKRGGRWFCSEEEATTAGFTPSSTG